MRILGICGSQRPQSSNRSLLLAAKLYLAQHEWHEFDIFSLPFFDPDLQYADMTPEIVIKFRQLAALADTIFITTPEYAHSAPGVLKNALEWMFHEGTQKKKVFVIIASGQGENTRAQLIETLNTMDFQTGPSQILLVQGPRTKLDSNGLIADDETDKKFKAFLGEMVNENTTTHLS